MSITDVYTLLDVNDHRVELIYRQESKRVLMLLSTYGVKVEAVPEELDYILTDLTIIRYNRIGSEGMESESDNGYSIKYNSADELERYRGDIESYAKRHSTDSSDDTGKVKHKGWRFY